MSIGKAHRTGLSNLLWANAKGAPNHPASLGNAHPTGKKIRETLTINILLFLKVRDKGVREKEREKRGKV